MIRPGKYRHYKGKEYQVLDVATHTQTNEPMVIYRSLDGNEDLWVCPASEWNKQVKINGQVVPCFTYSPKSYSDFLSHLWHEGSEEEWNFALAHYYTLCKDIPLDRFMEELQPETVEKMSVAEFYHFLHDRYFVWKYTSKNRLATTRSHLNKYLDNGQIDQLRQIHTQIFKTDRNDTEKMLTVVSQIKGLGISGASGLLSILFPEQFGTVDQFVILSLLKISDLPEYDQIAKMKPESITCKNGVILEQIFRQKAAELNKQFESQNWTPRKIDMVLWAFDR